MRTATKLLLIPLAILLVWVAHSQTAPTGFNPEYTSDGQLRFPENYREWVYLSSGFDMSYNPAMQMGHHMFDNVFVNPEAWRAFVKNGTWPDKTMFVLEARRTRARLTSRGIFRARP